jgi:hypothetical protein
MSSLIYPKLNVMGRMANQFFAISSAYGIAKKAGRRLVIPEWKYSPYFNMLDIRELRRVDFGSEHGEQGFHYHGDYFQELCEKAGSSIKISGYLQSEKYFEHCKEDIKKMFSFKEDFKRRLTEKYAEVFTKPVIAVHVRRGDYVGNPNYYNLPIEYYLHALEHNFPNWSSDFNIFVFSDDVHYCKAYLDTDGVFFSEGQSEVEDMCLMSLCNHFILSNSSYSWWGAWLGEKEGTIVVTPNHMFAGDLFKSHNINDFWPTRWRVFEHEDRRFDLKDVTFTIPVHYEHPDREEGLDRVVTYLKRYFDTNIVIGEQGSDKFGYFNCDYLKMDYPYFHRTAMLNEMCNYNAANEDIIVNYDADVIIPIIQILKAVHFIRDGQAEMVYPYDGRFARITKEFQHLPIDQLYDKEWKGSRPCDPISVGGCVFWNKESFIKAGMENEHFISYGPEDVERYERAEKLGVKIARVRGQLFHYDHFISNDSCGRNPFFGANNNELARIRGMSKDQLKKEISRWSWVKQEKATN